MRVQKWWLVLLLLLVLVLGGGCHQIAEIREARRAAATAKAERYPWAIYPISEESKRALCDALDLPAEDPFCEPGRPVDHWDVYKKVKALFPPGTPYAEVEAKLGRFPHVKEESRQPDGTLVGLRYVYQLTEYEGACIYFQLDLKSKKLVTRVYATTLGSGPQRPKCGPADRPKK